MLADKIKNAVNLRDCYKISSEAYEKQGAPKKALHYYKLFTSVKDSVFSAENSEAMTQAELEFEFSKEIGAREAEREKERAINKEKLKNEKIQKYAFGVFVVLALLMAGLQFKRFQEKKKAKRIP